MIHCIAQVPHMTTTWRPGKRPPDVSTGACGTDDLRSRNLEKHNRHWKDTIYL